MEKVIVVVGPTGVGKTRMGVALAKYFNGEVISYNLSRHPVDRKSTRLNSSH